MVIAVLDHSARFPEPGYGSDLFAPFFGRGAVEDWDPDRRYGPGDHVICAIRWRLASVEAVMRGDWAEALCNRDFEGVEHPIRTPLVNRVLESPRSSLLLYNDWECRDLDSHAEQLREFTECHLGLPAGRVRFTMCNYRAHLQRRSPQVLSMGWPVIREGLTDLYRPDPVPDPRYRILSLNKRGCVERYAWCAYVRAVHPRRVAISYLDDTVPRDTSGVFRHRRRLSTRIRHLPEWLRARRQFLHPWLVALRRRPGLLPGRAWQRFGRQIPLRLDGPAPDQHSTRALAAVIEQSWVYLCFETNAEPPESDACQVSEKTYKGIKLGKPFVVFTTRGGVLAHLRELGFRTFAPWIDESYDDPELGYGERFRLLLRLTDQLCRLGEAQRRRLDAAMRPAVEHNLVHLRSPDRVPPFFEALVSTLDDTGMPS